MLHCQLYSTHYTAVKIKKYSKSISVIRVDTTDMQRKPLYDTTKLTLFTANKDKWNTNEDTGMSMKNILHVLRYAKGTSQAEVTSSSDKIKPIASAVIKLP